MRSSWVWVNYIEIRCRTRELIEERGCKLVFLPSYSSPEFSTIEEAFRVSSRRCFLRRAQARTKEALVEAIGRALSERLRPAMRSGLVWPLRLPTL